MISVEEIDLHDALLKGLEIDYVGGIAMVSLEYYVDASDAERKPLKVTFSEIQGISVVSDFISLRKNVFAGNVSYWHPAQDGSTYIYLTEGYIEIKAKIHSLS